MRRHFGQRDDSYDLLNQYLQEIARVPRVTQERERELGRGIREGNDLTALEELVKANLRFVVSFAKRYRNSQVSFLDLINEGNIGLIQAAKKFDPDKNVRFITYAVWWIRQSILHALSEQGGTFRLPPKQANLMYRLERSMAAAVADGNPVPTTEELAGELGVTAREVQTLLDAGSSSFSLSSEMGEDSRTELSEMIEQKVIPSAELAIEEESRRTELLGHMALLTVKERFVLTLRHGMSDSVPRRIEELAAILSKPVEEIRTMLTRAVSAICAALAIDQDELAQLLLFTNPSREAKVVYWERLGDLEPGSSPLLSSERRSLLDELKQRAAVQSEIEKLPLLERTVLRLRFGILQDEEMTLRDIGEILNISRERVRQIEARAEAKCRRGAGRRDAVR